MSFSNSGVRNVKHSCGMSAGDEHMPCYDSLFIIKLIRKIAKKNVSFVMPVCLYVRPLRTSRPPLDEVLCNLAFGDFSKICRDN